MSEHQRPEAILEELTVAVIARNEAAVLPAFFDAAGWARHVALYDDGSTDATVAIARERGATVVDQDPSCADFATKRNRLQREVRTKWVLWLDADELITTDGLNQVLHVLGQRDDVAGLRFRIHNHFLGRRMRGRAWTRWRGLRLALTAGSRWQGSVHERLSADGPVVQLTTPIIHLGDHTYRRRANKSLHYNILEIKRMARRPYFAEVMLRPPLEFLRYYVFKYGFVDGKAGMIFAGHVWASWFQRLAMAYTEPHDDKAPTQAAE